MQAIDVISKSLFPPEHLKIIPYMTFKQDGGSSNGDKESKGDSFGTYSDDAVENQHRVAGNQKYDQEIVTGKAKPLPKV
jgi:hypothetical protein